MYKLIIFLLLYVHAWTVLLIKYMKLSLPFKMDFPSISFSPLMLRPYFAIFSFQTDRFFDDIGAFKNVCVTRLEFKISTIC